MVAARTDVLVIGAGVVGLTTAVVLAEQGLGVRVRALQAPQHTTSAAAGAIWGPHLADHESVPRWSNQSLEVFRGLTGHVEAGVRMLDGLEVARTPMPAPGWMAMLDHFRVCPPAELPEGFATGWRYTAPVIDMPVYLGYLLQRLVDAGGKLESGVITSLDELRTQAAIAVNCTGVGARQLVPDPEVTPTRGQLVVVDNPGLETFFAEDTGESPEMTYILPHGDRLILGSSAERGRSDLEPAPETAAAILRRCTELAPSIAGARIRAHRVGIRPVRSRVRLEHQRLDGCHVVHNYGHGGAGVTLSWGCAADVLSIVEQL
ncbi:MAG: FAD-dependent oxidoreductase [Micromonosporaceae bacterium]|jgi:D-amino-acid oxidase|nr:FAD-dependent oxidoreductase [Micromonosporaceae bacterium]